MALRGGPGDDEIDRVRSVSLQAGLANRSHGIAPRERTSIKFHAQVGPNGAPGNSVGLQPPGTIGIADAIALADVVLLAMPGAAVPELVAAHRDALNGRLVIDATNDVGAERPHHADGYARFAPGARLARAFNTLGFEMFADPTVGGALADLLWCGPTDAGVEQLIADVGLRPGRVGDIEAIDVVDGVARLWLTPRPSLTPRLSRGLAAVRPAPFSARSRCAAREPVTIMRFCGARAPTTCLMPAGVMRHRAQDQQEGRGARDDEQEDQEYRPEGDTDEKQHRQRQDGENCHQHHQHCGLHDPPPW